MDISRRHVLTGGLGAGALVLAAAPQTQAAPSLLRSTSATVDPFTLGVASGDPTPDGVVLWTRLAVEPLAEDGRGGMPSREVAVQWQVAEDERMSRIVAQGTALARPESAHTVHVEVGGLRPGREYFYRFRAGQFLSAVARTRTAPALWETPAALAMSFASCSQFEHGWFTAYRRLAEDQPDLVLHLGDYQYEYKAKVYISPTGNVRDHEGPETVDLATYRQRHAQYKSDPDLQAAHAIAPWLVVWDDHEIDNNWADDIPENRDAAQWNDTHERFMQRRAAAFRAYYENMPLRRSSVPAGTDLQLYRRIQWGQLANFHMMDTRQYRDDQACGDGARVNCAERLDPARTITGAEQESWLLDGFRKSNARWDVLGQQVFFAERDSNADPAIDRNSMDGWDGYAASRERITRGWVDAGVRNAVVLTGDVHRHWASDVKVDYKNPDSPVVGSELVCSSITSGGDGSPTWDDPIRAWNPHLKFSADQRGYVRTTITPTELKADFRSMRAVTQQGADAYTQASFRIADRHPGLQRTA